MSGAPRPDDLAAALQAAGFEQICVDLKPASRSFIKDWLPGSGAEDYVVSANITARKPGDAGAAAGKAPAPAAAAWAESEGEQMPARLKASLERQAKAKEC